MGGYPGLSCVKIYGIAYRRKPFGTGCADPDNRAHENICPDKSGAFDRSMQHHLIQVCSLRVVLYEARETVWTFCDREA